MKRTSDPEARMEIGRLERIGVRELWKSEAGGFTTWLAENIDVLAEAVGFGLTVTAREKSVGSFSLDLLAEDDLRNMVVIENQLERTDHDHLGKLLTYLSNLEAKTAIWISPEPRPEHIAAANWLNEFTPDDVSFLVVKVEGVRIGGSPPAANFSVVARPTSQGREIGHAKKEEAERHLKRREFWARLLEKARRQGFSLFDSVSPGPDSWLGISRRGVQYNYVLRKDSAGLELYIDVGNEEKNKAIFDRLFAQKEQIEAEIEAALLWNRREGKRSAGVRLEVVDHGLAEEGSWSEMQTRMIDGMQRFSKAFMGRLEG
jgi:hypothetical protein